MITPVDTEKTGMSGPESALLPINAVERETGISKELLRMWERRYGFPNPDRDENGDRIYPSQQIHKLRLIRRLLDSGFRPGKIVGLESSRLEELVANSHSSPVPSLPRDLESELLNTLRSRDATQVRAYLHHQLVRMGLESFILELVQHANTLVGDAWMRGEIEIFEEHLYTEELQTLVRQSFSTLQQGTLAPKVMLTTAPDEHHSLGLLMVEALLRLERVEAFSFGTQMPVRDIVQAAARHRMDIVMLSFSAAFPANRALDFIEELRFRLPLATAIWVGGNALRTCRRTLEGVQVFHDLPGVIRAVRGWHRIKGVKAA